MTNFDPSFRADVPLSNENQPAEEDNIRPPSPSPTPDWGMFLLGATVAGAVVGGLALALSGDRETQAAPTPAPAPSPPMSPEAAAAARKAEQLVNLAGDDRTPENERRNAGVRAAEIMKQHDLVPRPKG